MNHKKNCRQLPPISLCNFTLMTSKQVDNGLGRNENVKIKNNLYLQNLDKKLTFQLFLFFDNLTDRVYSSESI